MSRIQAFAILALLATIAYIYISYKTSKKRSDLEAEVALLTDEIAKLKALDIVVEQQDDDDDDDDDEGDVVIVLDHNKDDEEYGEEDEDEELFEVISILSNEIEAMDNDAETAANTQAEPAPTPKTKAEPVTFTTPKTTAEPVTFTTPKTTAEPVSFTTPKTMADPVSFTTPKTTAEPVTFVTPGNPKPCTVTSTNSSDTDFKPSPDVKRMKIEDLKKFAADTGVIVAPKTTRAQLIALLSPSSITLDI